MHEKQQKELLVRHILKHLPDAPNDAAQRLILETVADLEHILASQSEMHAKQEAAERVSQHAAEMRRESQLEGAFVHACRTLINSRYLCSTDSNRAVLESLLNPGETASAKLYVALAEQFPTKFAWETPSAPVSKQDQRAAFESFVRENNLSSCEANFQLFKQGASIENFAGASQIERAAYAEQAALERNKWLRTRASPLELKAEARYETQNQAAANQQAYADATLEAQKQRDKYAGYKPLPAHIDRKALVKASKDELRKWSRLYGQFQLNTALRGQQ
jgi:hypothetical protein